MTTPNATGIEWDAALLCADTAVRYDAMAEDAEASGEWVAVWPYGTLRPVAEVMRETSDALRRLARLPILEA